MGDSRVATATERIRHALLLLPPAYAQEAAGSLAAALSAAEFPVPKEPSVSGEKVSSLSCYAGHLNDLPDATSRTEAATARSKATSGPRPVRRAGFHTAANEKTSRNAPARSSSIKFEPSISTSKPAKQAAEKDSPATESSAAVFEAAALEILPPLAGVAVELDLRVSLAMKVAEKDTLVLELPDFLRGDGRVSVTTAVAPDTDGAQPLPQAVFPDALTGEWKAPPSSHAHPSADGRQSCAAVATLVLTVGTARSLPARVPLNIRVPAAEGVVSPTRGIMESDLSHFVLTCTVKGVHAVAPMPLQSITPIRGSVHSEVVQRGAAWLAWGELCVGTRPEVAVELTHAILSDTDGVPGRTCTAVIAAAVKFAAIRTGCAPGRGQDGVIAAGVRVRVPLDAVGQVSESGEVGSQETSGSLEHLALVQLEALREKDQAFVMGLEDQILLGAALRHAELLIEAEKALAGAGNSTAALVERARLREAEYVERMNGGGQWEELEEKLDRMAEAFRAVVGSTEGDAVAEGWAWFGIGVAREEAVVAAHVLGVSNVPRRSVAGRDESATDSANLDEVRALLKQRGLFGEVTDEDTVLGLEAEHHENVQFGLHHQAEQVASLLAWFHDYGRRESSEKSLGCGDRSRGREAAPDGMRGPPLVEQEQALLREAAAAYGNAAVALQGEGEREIGEVSAHAAQVALTLGDASGAVEHARRAVGQSPRLAAAAGVTLAVAQLAEAQSRGIPPDGGQLLQVVRPALLAYGRLAERLACGDARVVQQHAPLCRSVLRLSNLVLPQLALCVGTLLLTAGAHGDSRWVLESAERGLVEVSHSGAGQRVKAEASLLLIRVRVRLAEVLCACGARRSAEDVCNKAAEALAFAGRAPEVLELALENAQLAARVAPSHAEWHAAVGEALLELRESHPDNHPARKEGSDVRNDLLDQAETAFRMAAALEDTSREPLTDASACAENTSSEKEGRMAENPAKVLNRADGASLRTGATSSGMKPSGNGASGMRRGSAALIQGAKSVKGAGKTSSAAASPSMLRKAATARPLAVPQARTKSAVSVGSAKSWASHRQGMALGVGNAVPGGGARVSGENCGEIEAVETMCMETMCKVERRCTDGASTFARKRSEGDSTNVRSARVRMGIAKVMAERAGSDVTALEAEQVDALVEAFDAVLQVEPRNVEAYMRGGELLQLRDPARAAAAFQRFPFNFDAPDKDDAFVAGEVARLLMRGKRHTEWKRDSAEVLAVGRALLVMAAVQGLSVCETYFEKLELANHTGIHEP